MRNRTCAIKDRLPVAAKGVSRPLLLPVCRGSRHGVVSTTSHLFMCSRQTGEEHSRASDRSRCRDLRRYTAMRQSQRLLSLFLKKNLGSENHSQTGRPTPGIRSPANPVFIGIGGRLANQPPGNTLRGGRFYAALRTNAACGPCGNRETGRSPQRRPAASRSR
jgi:hypothetical protein